MKINTTQHIPTHNYIRTVAFARSNEIDKGETENEEAFVTCCNVLVAHTPS